MTNKSGVRPSPAVYPQPQITKPPLFPLEYKKPFLAKEPRLIKVVIDSNVYISAILFRGQPDKVLRLAKIRELRVFISPEILLEISHKLHKKFKLSEEEVTKVLKGISKITEIIQPKIKLKVVKEDPSDNKVIECAVVADAGYIITGDKHLLKMREFEQIKIVTPSDFLRTVK
ncbi:MAG: putative toxin-antitoxin system toxin component, PIN family [Patescibacteria group bacterium]